MQSLPRADIGKTSDAMPLIPCEDSKYCFIGGWEMEKTLFILIGPHAVGMMTVGQELAKMTGL